MSKQTPFYIKNQQRQIFNLNKTNHDSQDPKSATTPLNPRIQEITNNNTKPKKVLIHIHIVPVLSNLSF